jgi:hypothetical protein
MQVHRAPGKASIIWVHGDCQPVDHPILKIRCGFSLCSASSVGIRACRSWSSRMTADGGPAAAHFAGRRSSCNRGLPRQGRFRDRPLLAVRRDHTRRHAAGHGRGDRRAAVARIPESSAHADADRAIGDSWIRGGRRTVQGDATSTGRLRCCVCAGI